MDNGVINDLTVKIWKPKREGQNKEETIHGRFFIHGALSKVDKSQSHLVRDTDVTRWAQKRCGTTLVGERAR